jgi:phosphoserine phosphatase RsbU/P
MRPVELIAFAIAILICAAGAAAIAGHFLRRDSRERLLLWFGLFAGIYGVRMFFKPPLAEALNVPPLISSWTEVTLTDLILIPGLLFGQELYGSGWRGSFRWTIIGTATYAVVAAIVDAVAKQPDLVPDPSIGVLVAIAAVLIAGARAGYRPPPFPEWRVLLMAIAVFLVFVVNEHAVGAHVVPWRVSVEPIGFLLQLLCLGYIAVSRFFAQGRQLASVDQEMRSAREIQTSILPHNLPEIPGVRIAARYLPLAAVAGDFYDVIALEGGAVAVLVADVSGHGVPAALIASMVKVAFTSALQDTQDPGALLTRMNTTLCGMFARSYVTAVCIVISRADCSLRYAIAGHPPPLLLDRRDGAVVELDERGIFLGFTPSAMYATTQVLTAAHARLILYTDGVTETPNARDDLFGLERLAALTAAERAAAPEVFADRVVGALHDFATTAAFAHDDVTLVIVDVAILDRS